MIPKTPPETSGAIRARLAYLRNRKAALDETILCLERYEKYCLPLTGRAPQFQTIAKSQTGRARSRPRETHWAGAA
jgi:hypothetical protein